MGQAHRNDKRSISVSLRAWPQGAAARQSSINRNPVPAKVSIINLCHLCHRYGYNKLQKLSQVLQKIIPRIQGHRKINATRADATLVTAIASTFFLSTLIPTAPTIIDAKTQQTTNGTPSTTSRLPHDGPIICIRIASPTPIPSSNADILPNNIIFS